MSIPAGYYELRVIEKRLGHPHVLEIAEKHRTEPFYEALRELGEQELRGGRVQEQAYQIWCDGHHWASRKIGEALLVNEARYVPNLSWAGFNDEYEWETGVTQLNIDAPDKLAPAFRCFDAKQKLWPLVSGGLREGDLPNPVHDLSTVEPITNADGRIIQVRATFASPENAGRTRVCLIECDPAGEPARIVHTTVRDGGDERTYEFAAADWREIAPGRQVAFRVVKQGTWDGNPFDETIELRTYRPLESDDEDAFYPPAPSTINELTGRSLYQWVEDRRETPPRRYVAEQRAALDSVGVRLPTGPSARRWWLLGVACAGVLGAALLLRARRRRTAPRKAV